MIQGAAQRLQSAFLRGQEARQVAFVFSVCSQLCDLRQVWDFGSPSDNPITDLIASAEAQLTGWISEHR